MPDLKKKLPGLFKALTRYSTPLSTFLKRFRYKVVDGQIVRADTVPRALREGAEKRDPKPFKIDVRGGKKQKGGPAIAPVEAPTITQVVGPVYGPAPRHPFADKMRQAMFAKMAQRLEDDARAQGAPY